MTDDAPRPKRENAIPLDDILVLVDTVLGSLAPDRLVTLVCPLKSGPP